MVIKGTIEIRGVERKVTEWPVVTGCVDQAVHGWSDHRRAKCWTATVACDKASPGGLAREFWTRGSSSWVVVPAGLKPGDYLEVAADYYSGSGRKSAKRAYLRVLAVEDGRLVVRESGAPGSKPPDVNPERLEVGLGPWGEPAQAAADAPANPLAGFSDEEIRVEAVRRGLFDRWVRLPDEVETDC